jgi:hypothetical protein
MYMSAVAIAIGTAVAPPLAGSRPAVARVHRKRGALGDAPAAAPRARGPSTARRPRAGQAFAREPRLRLQDEASRRGRPSDTPISLTESSACISQGLLYNAVELTCEVTTSGCL